MTETQKAHFTPRKLVFAFFTLAVLAVATPAQAIHKGTVCKNFAGPDGSGGVSLSVCLTVNDHDFEDKIQAKVVLTNTGNGDARVHTSYLRLVKGSTTVRDTGPWAVTVPDGLGGTIDASTAWYLNPRGTFHSRIRMWVCWLTLPGDPCGSIVVWNSGDVTY